MGDREGAWLQSRSRRRALRHFAALLAASPLAGATAAAQYDPRPFSEHRRLPGLDEIRDIFEFEPLFHANVPRAVYDYTAQGEAAEFTLQRNRQAFDWVDLVAGRAADRSSVDLSTTLLGMSMSLPVLIAPSATMVPVHPDGEIGMYQASTAAGNTPMILSHNSSIQLERVAASAAGPLWSQFYPQRNRDTGQDILRRAQAAGCRAIVVTVDQQASYYDRAQHNRHLGGSSRPGPRGGGAAPAPAAGPALYRVNPNRLWYTWDYLDEIRPLIKVPMLIKGVLSADDAVRCIDRGADGIIVSNHGGRSMDYGPSTLEMLPEIVDAVNGRVPVLTDSGYRRGSDILKALALGADGVLLGRASRWALGAFGPAGVQHMLAVLREELTEAVAATGRTRLAAVDRTIVRTRFP